MANFSLLITFSLALSVLAARRSTNKCPSKCVDGMLGRLACPGATITGSSPGYTTGSTPQITSVGTVSPSQAPVAQPPVPTPITAPAPPAPAPVPGNSGGSSGGNDANAGGNAAEIQMYLNAHNTFRATYNAPDLTWNDELASKAQQWANNCKFVHSGGTLGPYGENLAAGTGSYSILDGIKAWTDEAPSYNPNNPTFSHFTQVVWKSTTQLGCAYQFCDGIFAASYGQARFVVCEYAVPGNVEGAAQENVLV